MTASNLVAVDKEAKTIEGEGRPEVTAACIHLGIRRVCPKATVIMHIHQPFATTLGELLGHLLEAFPHLELDKTI